MADKVGLKVGIDGEREFKSAIKDIETSYRLLTSEMKLAQTQFDKNDRSAEALRSRNEFLNREIDSQAQKVEVLERAVQNAAETYGEADARTMRWTIQLNNAKTALANTEKELAGNVKELESMGKETDKANGFMTKFSDGLAKTKDMAEKTAPSLSKIGSGMKTVGTALVGAAAAINAAAIKTGKAIWETTKQTAEHGDTVDKLSQKLGLSRQAYQEWDYTLGQSGIDINSLQGGIKTLTNTIDSARSGTVGAIEKFALLGIGIDDLNTKSREDIFAMTIMGLQGMTDESEKAALANTLLGRSGSELAPLLNTSAEATQDLINRAHELGYVMSDEAVASAAVFGDSLDDLGKAFSGVKNQITGNLLPGFTMILQGLTDLLIGNEDAKEKIRAGVIETVNTVRDVLPQIKETLMMIIDIAAEIIPDIISAIVEFITENLPHIMNVGIELALKLVAGIIAAIPDIVKQLPAIVAAIVRALKDAVPQFTEIGREMVFGIWEGIKGLGAWLGEQVKSFFGNIVGGIKNLLGIRSPSKVFAGIGHEMAAGIGVGFNEEMKKVAADINVDLGAPTPTPGTRTPIASSGGVGQTVLINNIVTLDGKIISDSNSRYQAVSNRSEARAKGVPVLA